MAKFLRIAAPHDGYRRAGIAFTKAPSDHAVAAFNKARLAQLKNDPVLSVIEFEATEKAADKTAEHGADGSLNAK